MDIREALREHGATDQQIQAKVVATAFIPNPEGKPQVNHIDGNPGNNSVTNLEWVTDKENREKAEEIKRLIRKE